MNPLRWLKALFTAPDPYPSKREVAIEATGLEPSKAQPTGETDAEDAMLRRPVKER